MSRLLAPSGFFGTIIWHLLQLVAISLDGQRTVTSANPPLHSMTSCKLSNVTFCPLLFLIYCLPSLPPKCIRLWVFYMPELRPLWIFPARWCVADIWPSLYVTGTFSFSFERSCLRPSIGSIHLGTTPLPSAMMIWTIVFTSPGCLCVFFFTPA